jgi:hypothetical protein
MRAYVSPPVDADDCVCGAASLWWAQELSRDESLWETAATATTEIRRALEEKRGLAWWARVQSMGQRPVFPFTLATSSVGVDPVLPAYGPLRVGEVHMLSGAYRLPPAARGSATVHAHTFDGRLHVTVSYAHPSFSDAWAEAFADRVEAALHALARGDAPTLADAVRDAALSHP